jgi:hypothetical protein
MAGERPAAGSDATSTRSALSDVSYGGGRRWLFRVLRALPTARGAPRRVRKLRARLLRQALQPRDQTAASWAPGPLQTFRYVQASDGDGNALNLHPHTLLGFIYPNTTMPDSSRMFSIWKDLVSRA